MPNVRYMFGKPAPNRVQVSPPLVESNTPLLVPRNSVSPVALGTITKEFAEVTEVGKAEMLLQVVPKLLVTKTRPVLSLPNRA